MKGNRTLGFLRRNLKQCTTPVKAATSTAIVRPAVEYASTVWDPYQQKHIKAVEQVQRRAARYVCNNYTDRIQGCASGMVQDLQWVSLEDRHHTSRLRSSMGWLMLTRNFTLSRVTAELEALVDFSRIVPPVKCIITRRTIRDWNKLPPLPPVWRSSEQGCLSFLLTTDLHPAVYMYIVFIILIINNHFGGYGFSCSLRIAPVEPLDVL